MASLLSQYIVIGKCKGREKSYKRCASHSNLDVVAGMALYSASTEDLATVFCFLVFHETKEESRKTQYPVRELAKKWQVPQSASQEAVKCKSHLAE